MKKRSHLATASPATFVTVAAKTRIAATAASRLGAAPA